MTAPVRTFTDSPAVRERVPLLIGLVAPSGAGKTYSALRLATGIQRVVGGSIFGIDTEARRMLHYADLFQFRHIDFKPPHGPLDYLAAIEHAVEKGTGVLIIDSMTHEHSGDGGVMDQSERYLERKCKDDEECRKKNFMLSLAVPKGQRKKLNRRIVQLGLNCIFCYRAQEKVKPQTGRAPLDLGWQPETTSPLQYDMTATFLLPPHSDGVPNFLPETNAEKLYTKLPVQFRDWFKPGVQLSEDIGERLAKWAVGDSKPELSPAASGDTTSAAITSIGGLLAQLPNQEAKKAAIVAAFSVRTWREVQSLSREKLEHGLALLQRARQESDDQAEAQRMAAAQNEQAAGVPRGVSPQEPPPGSQGSLLP